MSEIRTPKTCGIFKPGHNPHWIQIHRATQDKDNVPMPGRLIEVSDDGSVLIEVQWKVLRLWNHDVERLVEAINAADGLLTYQDHWGLLWVPGDNGQFVFCSTQSKDHVSCPNEAPSGTPVELLASAGGFTISGETAALLDDFQ
jgi:hypothetical protein